MKSCSQKLKNISSSTKHSANKKINAAYSVPKKEQKGKKSQEKINRSSTKVQKKDIAQTVLNATPQKKKSLVDMPTTKKTDLYL